MKKKILILLLISMIALLGLGLSACNNATPQGQLANILADHTYEKFEYDVHDTAVSDSENENIVGTYVVELKSYAKGASVPSFGTASLDSVKKGILVKGALSVGTTEYETGCYYSLVNGMSYMVPTHSYRIQKENGTVVFSLQGIYDSGSFTYDKKVGNGEIEHGYMKVSGTVFDNNQFQQGLRSITTFDAGLSLSFSTPVVSATDEAVASLRAVSSNKVEKVQTYYTKENAEWAEKEGIECYKVDISRSTAVAGKSQTLWYAKDVLSANGWEFKTVLVKMEEPYKAQDGTNHSMIYTLKTASLE